MNLKEGAMANEDVNKEIEQLKKDLSGLQNDIRNLTGTLKSAGIEQGKATYERARQQGEQWRQKGEDAIGSVGQAIDEKPVTSVLTAFGTGFVIGLLLNQKRQ
jgi:ElaB/YqjD/DUF883 family membrane-anchored ribosome-binding protein